MKHMTHISFHVNSKVSCQTAQFQVPVEVFRAYCCQSVRIETVGNTSLIAADDLDNRMYIKISNPIEDCWQPYKNGSNHLKTMEPE